MTKLKILCSSIWYPLSISRYFEKAFRHRDDIDFKTAGVYTGSWIPWMGGMNLPEKYAIPPDVPLPFGGQIGEFNYELVKTMLNGWTPDLIVQIDAGLHFKYKPVDGMVVTVGTDPHVLNDWYDTPRKYSDKFFNMQACYSKPGDIYLPYAYSQYDHFPDDSTKDVDAVMIGMPYEKRVNWINELRNRGVSVIFENGPVFDEARAMYNRGRIGLSWSSMEDLIARVYELPAMKLYPVVNNVPDMWKHEYLHHHHIFNNMNEAIDAVVWAKEHPENAAWNAQECYTLIQGQHYDARVDQIMKECGF